LCRLELVNYLLAFAFVKLGFKRMLFWV